MKFGNLARLLIAAGLLTAIVLSIGSATIGSVFQQARISIVMAAYCLVVADSFVRAVNWGQLLHGLGVRCSAAMMHYCLLAGGFFASLMPSSVSTDVARSVFAARVMGGSVDQYAATIVSLNLVGLLAVCLWGVLAAVVYLVKQQIPIPALCVLAGGACYVAVFFLARGWIAKWRVGGQAATDVAAQPGWRGRLKKFAMSLLTFTGGRASLRNVLGVSLVNQANRITVLYLVASSVGAGLSWLALCLCGPLLVVARALPLSMAGFGIDQAGFVGLALLFGVQPQQALVISLINSMLYLALDLLGGVVYSIAVSRRMVAVRFGRH